MTAHLPRPGSRPRRPRSPICRGGRSFGDPPLDALINEALANSYDLADAVARVDVARENARISTDALLPADRHQRRPVVSADLRRLLVGAAGVPGAAVGQLPLRRATRRRRRCRGSSTCGAACAACAQAALADFFASEDNRRGVIVSLIGHVAARATSRSSSLDLQLEIARRTVESRQQTLALFARARGGRRRRSAADRVGGVDPRRRRGDDPRPRAADRADGERARRS